MKKKVNRAHRTLRLLRQGWFSSLDIIHSVGSVTPSKCLHAARQIPGWTIKRRTVNGIHEYHAVRQ